MKGVIDRLTENNRAVILIESIGKEIIVSQSELPKGAKAQDWVNLKQSNGSYEILSVDYEKTASQRAKVKKLQAKLRTKSRGSKFKRKK